MFGVTEQTNPPGQRNHTGPPKGSIFKTLNILQSNAGAFDIGSTSMLNHNR
jgi:hypothetical protein